MSKSKRTIEKEVIKKKSKPLKDQIQKTRVRRKSYVMDLRIHSPASLGYLGIEGIDTAPAMVRLAKVKGLDVIAVTDFFSGDFIDRVQEAAKESPVTVIPGVTIRCCLENCDDVILAVLFPEDHSCAEIESFLTALGIPNSKFGNREFVLETPFPKVLSVIEKRGGVAIPSRMDKTPHRRSVISYLVEDYGFRAFDLAFVDSKDFFKKHWPKTKFEFLSFSSANALAQVGSRISRVKMPEATFTGIRDLVERVS